jgi:hypothetical protein
MLAARRRNSEDRNKAATMLSVIGPAVSLFHTPAGTAYADLMIRGHRETWPIRSQAFRRWLRRRYYEATGAAASLEAIKPTIDLLEAKAQFDSPEREVYVRIAERDAIIYLDLADDEWRAVEISPAGWSVIGSPPVRFRRAMGMLPIPAPQTDGSLQALRSFLNIRVESEFVLLVAWLLAALKPGGPFPLLAVAGEQGSAKTGLTKILRALVDPNTAPARALPRDERELMISANNGHLLAFDNVSSLGPWLSDAFCRIASGSSFAVRRLYTDDDEVLFQAARPIIFNGIENVITRPDLADRCIFITLGSLSDLQRRPEKVLWQEFETTRRRILGALLDAMVHGLLRKQDVQLEKLPRMADFAVWATACETILWPAATFARAYAANRRAAIEESIDFDPVSVCLRELISERGIWAGSATDLLHAATRAPGNNDWRRSAAWPKTPRALAGRLRRAQTFLRTLGIEIAFTREGQSGTRIITVRMGDKSTVSIVSGLRHNGFRANQESSIDSAASILGLDAADGADANL